MFLSVFILPYTIIRGPLNILCLVVLNGLWHPMEKFLKISILHKIDFITLNNAINYHNKLNNNNILTKNYNFFNSIPSILIFKILIKLFMVFLLDPHSLIFLSQYHPTVYGASFFSDACYLYKCLCLYYLSTCIFMQSEIFSITL